MSRLVAELDLSSAEEEYLCSVSRHVRRVPRRPRRAFVRETSELLSSRPTAESPRELVVAFGQPTAFAQAWIVAEGFDRWTPPWEHWWHQSGFARGVQLAALGAMIIAALGIRSYYVATPDLFNSCGGAAAPDVEVLRAAGETEYRTELIERQRYGLQLCPHTRTEGVAIERVYLSVAPRRSVQPVGWELNLERLTNTITGDASAHAAWRPAEVPWLGRVIVWLEAAYCGNSGISGFDSAELDYRYRGRLRTATLSLGYTLSIDSADTCTEERRARDDAEYAAWSGVVDSSISRAVRWDGIGELGLSPESMSRDLCRYLEGIVPSSPRYDQFEPLSARAVFQLDDAALAETLIDGAVLGICSEFAEQRDELIAILDPST